MSALPINKKTNNGFFVLLFFIKINKQNLRLHYLFVYNPIANKKLIDIFLIFFSFKSYKDNFTLNSSYNFIKRS